MDLMKIAENEFVKQTDYPNFKSGDTVTVHYKIKEGDKERIQQFRGVVIQRKGSGATETFTVRKMSGSYGVERIFPVVSPFIDKIQSAEIISKCVGVFWISLVLHLFKIRGKRVF